MASIIPITIRISNASISPVITSGPLNTTQVLKASIANTDTANSHAVTLYSVSSGGSPSSSNVLEPSLVIPANSSVIVSRLQGQACQSGGSFQAVADVNNILVLTATVYSTP